MVARLQRNGKRMPPPLDGPSCNWPEEWRAAYDERVAIAVMDGEQSEETARALAADYIRRAYQHGTTSTT
jgi:hypothetical protein